MSSLGMRMRRALGLLNELNDGIREYTRCKLVYTAGVRLDFRGCS